MLPQYEFRYLNIGKFNSGRAILYRRATVELIDEPEPIYDATVFGYVPITQRVRIGSLTFRLVNVHLSWGGREGHNSKMRSEELQAFQEWIRHQKKRGKEPLLIGGMFFWDLDRPEMKSFQNEGFFFPGTELPDGANESPFQDKVRRYSQFVLDDSLKSRYIRKSIRYEDLRHIYPEFKEYKDWMNFLDNNPLLITLRVD